MAFLLIGLGGLVVWALTSGRTSGRPPAAEVPRSAAVAVPAPAPSGPAVVVIPDQPPITAFATEPTHDGGVITPPLEPGMGPRQFDIDPADIPPELLGLVEQGGSASVSELEAGARTADELGYPDIADWLRTRISRRTAYEAAQHEGMAPPRARDVPIPQQSQAPEALPAASANRAELSRLATRLADNIRRSAPRQYDRSLLIRFQTAAGLRADGKYGRQSANALGLYGHLPAGQVPEPQY